MTYAMAEEFRQTEGFSVTEADRRAAQISTEIRALGVVNVKAVEEYAETKARVDELSGQREDLEKAEKDLRDLIDRLLKQMESTFVENFRLLQGYFTETFRRLFGGGHAELILMDEKDPLNCGIEINAQPPGKKLQLLTLLSGGERVEIIIIDDGSKDDTGRIADEYAAWMKSRRRWMMPTSDTLPITWWNTAGKPSSWW